jgi:uncharacterized membrane protein
MTDLDENHRHEQPGIEKETGRLEAFSDGVFAIAITLLILTIAPPHGGDNIIAFVGEQWPFFGAYVVSFMTILVMWVNHHGIFNLVARADRPFLILNGVLLMLITFLNYPTAVVAESVIHNHSLGEQRFAALLYSGTLIVTSTVFHSVWRYASTNNRLMDDHVEQATINKITSEYRFGPFVYFVPLIVGVINLYASLLICLLLALYFGLTAQVQPTHAKRRPAQSVERRR